MARTTKPKKEISMEEALWKSADKLRGSVEPAEYKTMFSICPRKATGLILWKTPSRMTSP